MEKQKLKKFKWYVGLRAECQWLEHMAGEGWFLENIRFGVFYTFQKGEPKKMLYEVDRFDLPKKPSLEEIKHKEIFMEMAKELGWSEVTHDEILNYYLCKEDKEGEINELYNDAGSRKLHASKYKAFFHKKVWELLFWSCVLMIIDLILSALNLATDVFTPVWYHWFVIVYVLICNMCSLMYWKIGTRQEKEFLISKDEWEERQNSTDKVIRKLIITTRGLNRFLRRQEKEGYLLTQVTATKYYFQKKKDLDWIYTMDSRYLTNQRQKSRQMQSFKDKKDRLGMNNDWQIQSLKDAQLRGWEFVCALENRALIYKGVAHEVEALNDKKYDSSLRGISLIGDYGLTLLIAGVIGGFVGMMIAIFTI